ncbi:MAG: hypothetical protein ACI808_000947 [Paraglaciecola sp.]
MVTPEKYLFDNTPALKWGSFLYLLLCSKFLLLTLLLLLSGSAKSQVIVHTGEERNDYFTRLLKHVVTYSVDKNYQVKAFGASIPKDRDFEMLVHNDGIDVVFGGSTKIREQKYLAVRFPILGGLYGWRIPLVQKGREDLFQNVTTLEQFKQLKPGQFHRWSDTQVLLANNIDVVTGSDYEGLFGMLALARFDYFPRSVLEIDREYTAHQELDIAIESSVIIHYPTAFYFYVSKENQTLARDLEDGLESALQDGSLAKIFNHFFGDTINKVRGTKRRIIELDNPLLPKETPLQRAELWISLGQK